MVRRALIKDVPEIHKLVNYYAQQHKMLPVALSYLYERVRDFFVYTDGESGGVLGCGALIISWADLGEIRSLAVRSDAFHKGIGTAIVNECIEDAATVGLEKVFVLTYETDFFGKFGFKEIDKSELPHKIWSVCLNCPKYPNCDETAMLLRLD